MTNWPNKIFQANNLQKNKPETSCKQTTTTTSLWFLFSHQREAITCLMNCYLFPEETLLNWRKFAWDASQTFLGFLIVILIVSQNVVYCSVRYSLLEGSFERHLVFKLHFATPLENFLVLPFAFIDLVVYQLFLALTNFTFRSNDHSRPIFMMPSLIWAWSEFHLFF